jgi:hypothetical protein
MRDKDTPTITMYDYDDEHRIKVMAKYKNQWHGYSTYEKEGMIDTCGVIMRLSDDRSIKNKYETSVIQDKYEAY